MTAVVPISQLARRIPEAGRIRVGKKVGEEGRPVAIGEFRFTSHDREALAQIGEMYGGAVTPWSDPKAADGQFEVCTSAPEVRVVLPPDPLGGTPVYEMWGGGGCERRCDGESAQVMTRGPEGPEPTEVACKVTTHLSLILPEIRFAGVWRLTTHSWSAAQELPGMVDMIQSAQARGLPYATLAIKHRRTVTAGETRKFLIPVLGVAESIEALVSGAANVGQLPAPERAPQAALDAGDDDVLDAEELVDPADAERLAAILNAGTADDRRMFFDRFGCKPAELPLDQLEAANDFTSDLAAVGVEGTEA